MTDQMLLQEVERFIVGNPLGEGLFTIQGKRMVKAVYAGTEHRLGFHMDGAGVWIPFSWSVAGLSEPTIVNLTYRPDLVAMASQQPDDDDLAGLALWLVAANR